MGTNRFEVEGLMDELNLKYFSREDEAGCNWILMFNDGGLFVRLIENGEFLLVRSLPLAKLKRLTKKQRSNLLPLLLKRNNQMLLGHYSVDDEVVYESALPVEDGELTINQFKRCLGAVTSELARFESAFENMCQGRDPSDVEIDQLMRRLLDGPSDNEPDNEQEDAPGVDKPSPVGEERRFGVVLRSFEHSKLNVVKAVRALTGKSLLDCKRLVESVPAEIGRFESHAAASFAIEKLVEAGAIAAIE